MLRNCFCQFGLHAVRFVKSQVFPVWTIQCIGNGAGALIAKAPIHHRATQFADAFYDDFYACFVNVEPVVCVTLEVAFFGQCDGGIFLEQRGPRRIVCPPVIERSPRAERDKAAVHVRRNSELKKFVCLAPHDVNVVGFTLIQMPHGPPPTAGPFIACNDGSRGWRAQRLEKRGVRRVQYGVA